MLVMTISFINIYERYKMAKNVSMTEISEVLYQYSKLRSIREISKSLGLARNTVTNLIKEAAKYGLKPGLSTQELDDVILAFAKNRGKLVMVGKVENDISSYKAIIEDYLQKPHITGKQINKLLKEAHGFDVKMRTLYRYLSKYCPAYRQGKYDKITTVHLEVLPGVQAQVDFGYVGYMVDPLTQKSRKAHAFIMTLSYSRHRFVRFVFEQNSRTWIDCHKRAFQFFNGVPRNIVLDNLKAGVITPDVYDPRINREYGECERYYGFVADPAIIASPKHKGRVERSVPLVRQQILAGRNFADIEEANNYALKWCRYEIGQEITRTTGEKPYERFIRDEYQHLLPLKQEPFQYIEWHQAKVHKDCHIVFQGSFYSVPHQYVCQSVLVRADDKLIQIIINDQVIKKHIRNYTKGKWITDVADYQPDKGEFISKDASYYLKEAEQIGFHVHALLQQTLKSDSWQQRRKSSAILKLATTYGNEELERACKQLSELHRNEYSMLENILSQNQQQSKDAPKANCFLRNPQEFSHQEVPC